MNFVGERKNRDLIKHSCLLVRVKTLGRGQSSYTSKWFRGLTKVKLKIAISMDAPKSEYVIRESTDNAM